MSGAENLSPKLVILRDHNRILEKNDVFMVGIFLQLVSNVARILSKTRHKNVQTGAKVAFDRVASLIR